MSFLWDATDDGSGSAAQSSRWRPNRIPDRVRNLAVATIVGGVVAYLAAQMIFGAGSSGAWDSMPTDAIAGTGVDAEVATGLASPSPMPSETAGGPPSTKLREHAFGLHELRGLPPDVAPGTPLEIWVAWDEAVSEGPHIERLLMGATVARFIEPVTPEGPVVVVLNIPLRWMQDLLYGQRYGSLSVTIPHA